ncbi:MAG: hypothetical protein ACFFCI_05470 [Promethearchaeota archaeon]
MGIGILFPSTSREKDLNAPIVEIFSPINTVYNNATQLLEISATDNNGIDSIWYNWEGINETYTTALDITFNEGLNIIYAWANDSGGNVGSTSITFTIDSESPEITILSPINTIYNNATQLLEISAIDNSGIDSIWYNWEGINVTYTNTLYITFNEGMNTIYAWTNDSAGNKVSNRVTFTIDLVLPIVTILSPINTTYDYATQLLQITAIDSIGIETIWYNWEGINETYTTALDIIFNEGSNTIYVWANDSAGNKGSAVVTFFVTNAVEGDIKIIKENSIVIQKNSTHVDIFLKIKNVGNSIVLLDRFYANDDIVDNQFKQKAITYLEGGPVLRPNDKAYVMIQNADTDFFPIRTFNIIGVATSNNISDELLFTSNKENYSLSILSNKRIFSPEVLASLHQNYRKHIPIDFNNSYVYTYDNGSTILNIKIKNTGDIIFGLDSIYLTESLTEVGFDDFSTKSGSLNLESNEEDIVIIDATNYVSGNVNEEILICITGSFGTTVASDIGYIHTINDKPDIQVIKNVEGHTSSYIYANETGKVLIKNTGNEQLTLENVYINNTLVDNIIYLYGDSSLDIQECAIVSFDIPTLKVNMSDECLIRITTNVTAETIQTLNAYVDSLYYNIEIDDAGTLAINSGYLTILTNNKGLLNVTVDSVYINDTYFSLDAFNEQFFKIGSGDLLELTIDMAIIETKLGPISDGDNLNIIVRTIEGAEDAHIEIVI